MVGNQAADVGQTVGGHINAVTGRQLSNPCELCVPVSAARGPSLQEVKVQS